MFPHNSTPMLDVYRTPTICNAIFRCLLLIEIIFNNIIDARVQIAFLSFYFYFSIAPAVMIQQSNRFTILYRSFFLVSKMYYDYLIQVATIFNNIWQAYITARFVFIYMYFWTDLHRYTFQFGTINFVRILFSLIGSFTFTTFTFSTARSEGGYYWYLRVFINDPYDRSFSIFKISSSPILTISSERLRSVLAVQNKSERVVLTLVKCASSLDSVTFITYRYTCMQRSVRPQASLAQSLHDLQHRKTPDSILFHPVSFVCCFAFTVDLSLRT